MCLVIMDCTPIKFGSKYHNCTVDLLSLQDSYFLLPAYLPCLRSFATNEAGNTGIMFWNTPAYGHGYKDIQNAQIADTEYSKIPQLRPLLTLLDSFTDHSEHSQKGLTRTLGIENYENIN